MGSDTKPESRLYVLLTTTQKKDCKDTVCHITSDPNHHAKTVKSIQDDIDAGATYVSYQVFIVSNLYYHGS